ncbi:hypothetical protein GUITHDRAFT_46404, partial [Guillardia theta CCMP2712]
ECLLWDMDGVLVDVSGSYREAILKTAAHFGANITHQDIGAAKARGGANNDWKLTYDLIHAHKKTDGSSPTLEEVTKEFELLYQGTPTSPGLKKLETLLPSLKVLEELSKKYKMGIVTGRPKSDCEYALQTMGIAHIFQHCGCMEDG